jgi:hypothetical protein
MKQNALLIQLIQQFQQRHQANPKQIVIAPVALVALGIKDSLITRWNGIPVVCRLFDESEVVEVGNALGIFCRQNDQVEIRSCDLLLEGDGSCKLHSLKTSS